MTDVSFDDLVGAAEERGRDLDADLRAALRLRTSSNRVGCWAGVSPGRAPFSILSISAACMA